MDVCDSKSFARFRDAVLSDGYELVEPLGRGGQAEVWRAVRTADGLETAIKAIVDPTEESHLRLAEEHEVYRVLDGSSSSFPRAIAPLVSVHGSLGSRAIYFVMELVEGAPLLDYARDSGLVRHQRVELIGRCSEAVARLHADRIAHRDLKPSNILVRRDGSPCVIDFGMALRPGRRDTDNAFRTETELIRTTPRYSPPISSIAEQSHSATFREDGVQWDVYALGAMLFELLTGRVPHEEVVEERMIELYGDREDFPEQVHPLLRDMETGDKRDEPPDPRLEALVLFATHRDRRYRYSDAAAFAGDLRRWLEGRPLNRSVPKGLTSHAVHGLRWGVDGREARRAHQRTMQLHELHRLRGDHGLADDILETAGSYSERTWEWRHLRLVHTASLVIAREHRGSVNALQFDHTGELLLSARSDGDMCVHDAHTGQLLQTFVGHRFGTSAAVFTPSAARVWSGGMDGKIRCWDVLTGAELMVCAAEWLYREPTEPLDEGSDAAWEYVESSGCVLDLTDGEGLRPVVRTLSCSPRGEFIVCVTETTQTRDLWVLSTADLRVTTCLPGTDFELPDDSNGVGFSSSASTTHVWLPCGDSGSTVRRVDCRDGSTLLLAGSPSGWGRGVRAAADGERYLAWGDDGLLRLWHIEDGHLESVPADPTFGPDPDQDWWMPRGRPEASMGPLKGGEPLHVDCDRDLSAVVVAGTGRLRVMSLGGDAPASLLDTGSTDARAVAISAGGRAVATGHGCGTIYVRRPFDAQWTAGSTHGDVRVLAFPQRSSETVVTGSSDGHVVVVHLRDGHIADRCRVGDHGIIGLVLDEERGACFTASDDGRLLYTDLLTQKTVAVEVARPKARGSGLDPASVITHIMPSHSQNSVWVVTQDRAAARSHNGLSTSDVVEVSELRLLSFEGGAFRERVRRSLSGASDVLLISSEGRHAQGIIGVAIDSGKQRIATVGHDGFVIVWRIEGDSAPQPWMYQDILQPAHAIAFGPRSNPLLAVGLEGGVVLVLDDELEVLSEIRTGRSAVSSLAFSPDGRRLAVGDDAAVRLCVPIAPDDSHEVLRLPTSGRVADLGFTADGTSLIATTRRGSLHVWRSEAPEQPSRLAEYETVLASARAKLVRRGGADIESVLRAARSDPEASVAIMLRARAHLGCEEDS